MQKHVKRELSCKKKSSSEKTPRIKDYSEDRKKYSPCMADDSLASQIPKEKTNTCKDYTYNSRIQDIDTVATYCTPLPPGPLSRVVIDLTQRFLRSLAVFPDMLDGLDCLGKNSCQM